MSTDQAATGPEPVDDTILDDTTLDGTHRDQSQSGDQSQPGLDDTALDEGAQESEGFEGDDIDEDSAAEPDFDDGVLYEDQVQPEYGILGFTLRELLIVGVWALAFLASFFPVAPAGDPVWSHGLAWILSIGVPTVAVFLLVLRRFSPDGIRRVGSLGIDQFASVAFSVAAVTWAAGLWEWVAATIDSGVYLVGWVAVFETVAFLALVALTVFAPFLPRVREDFRGRLETLAHRNANPVRPVISRPRPESIPGIVAPVAGQMDAAGPATSPGADTDVTAGADAAPPAASSASTAVAGDVDPDATSVIEVIPADAPRLRADRTRGAEPTAAADSNDGDAAGESSSDDDASVAQPRQDDEPTMVIDDGRNVPAPAAAELADGDDAAADDRMTTDEFREIFSDSPASAAAQTAHGDHDEARDVTAEPGPFWILAGTERDVHDEHGNPLFRIGPQAWVLVVEDRDGAYVVRHDDGRIGYLHDITDITKG